jgi:hypothetical protein
MRNYEDRALGRLDAHFRTQLAEAADTYASSTDVDARLRAISTAVEDDDRGGTADGEG